MPEKDRAFGTFSQSRPTRCLNGTRSSRRCCRITRRAEPPTGERRGVISRRSFARSLTSEPQGDFRFHRAPRYQDRRPKLARVSEFPDRHSSQLDIIVYDMDAYPVFERLEEFCIVPPEGVIGVISVKKTLFYKDLAGEIFALKGAADLCRLSGRRGPFTALLAFAAKEVNDTN